MIRLTWLCDEPEDHEVVVFADAIAVVFEDRVGKTHVVTSLGRLPVKESVDEVLQRAEAEKELQASMWGRQTHAAVDEIMKRLEAMEEKVKSS